MNKEISKKSILIVGANGALAKETIKHLISDGAINVTMACRSESKGLATKKEIEESISSKKAKLSVIGGFDMNNPAKITKAIKSLSGLDRYDIVFLAAGFAVFSDDYESVEWNGKKVEKNIFQNLIGSHITLSELKKNNLLNKNARIVLAGGEGARGIKGMISKPEFSSVAEFRDYVFLQKTPKYNPMNAIGVSKLCGALWTSKISKLEEGNLEIIWFSPGLTSKSSGLKTLAAPKRIFMGLMFGILSLIGKSQDPKEGGRKNADCLTGKIGENGDLLGAPEGVALGGITDQRSMNSAFSNENLINEMWKILEEVTGNFA